MHHSDKGADRPRRVAGAGEEPVASTALRGLFGGTLMGLANLVPGISGGTMLLAAGIYPRFVSAVAEATTLKFRFRSVLLLAAVGVSAALAVLLLAGMVKDLVVHHRWNMYSIFIGLTLGGVPVLWKMLRPLTAGGVAGAAVGLLVMILLALLPAAGEATARGGGGAAILVLAGVAGASAMILPGVSGGYILLLMGQYIPILTAIEAMKDSLAAGTPATALSPITSVLAPVGIGVALGIVVVSNGIRWLLGRFRAPTLGVLLGLLLGAVVGLWPFQKPIEPILGETVIKGRLVTAENIAQFAPEDFPTAFFRPAAGQVAGAVGLVIAGGMATILISRIGSRKES